MMGILYTIFIPKQNLRIKKGGPVGARRVVSARGITTPHHFRLPAAVATG